MEKEIGDLNTKLHYQEHQTKTQNQAMEDKLKDIIKELRELEKHQKHQVSCIIKLIY